MLPRFVKDLFHNSSCLISQPYGLPCSGQVSHLFIVLDNFICCTERIGQQASGLGENLYMQMDYIKGSLYPHFCNAFFVQYTFASVLNPILLNGNSFFHLTSCKNGY